MTAYEIPDSPKMLRETLCVAQSLIGHRDLSGTTRGRVQEHIDRLQRLIDECDRHRPLLHGKHGGLHTSTCGCLNRPDPNSVTDVEEFLDS